MNEMNQQPIRCTVIVVSDRCARGETKDEAGAAIVALLQEKLNAIINDRLVLPDEIDVIKNCLISLADNNDNDLVITVGGTGFSPRDVTPEATCIVVERLTPGLDEAMRAASLKKTPYAMLSRAASGIRKATLIINLPGSTKGAVENLEVVMPALQHGIDKLRGDPSDCGRD